MDSASMECPKDLDDSDVADEPTREERASPEPAPPHPVLQGSPQPGRGRGCVAPARPTPGGWTPARKGSGREAARRQPPTWRYRGNAIPPAPRPSAPQQGQGSSPLPTRTPSRARLARCLEERAHTVGYGVGERRAGGRRRRRGGVGTEVGRVEEAEAATGDESRRREAMAQRGEPALCLETRQRRQ